MGTGFNTPHTRIARSGDIPVWDAKLGLWSPTSPGKILKANTALPKLPNDGDQFVYTAGAGVEWMFRYDASTAYWVFIGGSRLHALDASFTAITGAATWQDTITPSLTIPFAGDYEVTISGTASQTTANSTRVFYGLNTTGVTPVTSNAATDLAIGGARTLSTTVNATFTAAYLTRASMFTNTLNTGFDTRQIWVVPTRVQ